MAICSGAFISADGYIATAAHILRYRDEKLEIISPQFGRIPVKLVALDKGHDFLLLKADLDQKKAEFLSIAKQMPQPTETVYQMGSPLYRRGVMQSGTVARADTYFEFYGDRHNHYVEIIHVAASMQNGTSGGAWINQKGELIGVQSGTLIISESPIGIAFMSPLENFLPVIQSKKSARTYSIDFKTTPLEAHDANTIKRYGGYKRGLVVGDMPASSKAREVGLENWDLIIAANDTPVYTVKEMLQIIQKAKRSSVALTVVALDQDKAEIKIVPVEIVEDKLVFSKVP